MGGGRKEEGPEEEGPLNFDSIKMLSPMASAVNKVPIDEINVLPNSPAVQFDITLKENESYKRMLLESQPL